ncbi:MAG: FAD-dependent oxidoreductase [Dehalococcoidia bacterium]
MRVAIAGAGVAGLAASWKLSNRGVTVAVFERSGRLGGRVSTRSHGGAAFDDGAQFIRPDPGPVHDLLHHHLPSGDLANVAGDVCPFDAAGQVAPGDPSQNAQPKLVYRGGLAKLCLLFAKASAAHIQLGWPVAALERATDGWRLRGPKGVAGPFDAVVLTLPAPAAAEVLAASAFERDLRDALVAAYREVTYRAIISVAFGVSGDVPRPQDAYALVNLDRQHAVSWVAFEHCKPGYVPNPEGVIVAQMADGWSRPRMALPDGEAARAAWEALRGLLADGNDPRWAEVTRWPAALPNNALAPNDARIAESHGLFLAGDATVGPRAHLALESGLLAADRLLAR